MATSLQSIYSDFKYYFKSYQTFIRLTETKEENQWSEQWEGIVKTLFVNSEVPTSTRVLLVAAGHGLDEMKILEMILSQYPMTSVVVDVIEPVEEQLEIFKDNSPEVMTKYPNRLEFKWFVETFQGYMKIREENKSEEKFHLVVCLHGLYYFDDWADTLDIFYNLLVNGGTMATAIDSGDSECGRLFTKYREWEGDRTSLLTADDIISHLTKKGRLYQRFLRGGSVDVSSIFDKQSTEGNMILDFLVQRKDFRRKAPSPLFDKVMGFVRENSRKEGDKHLMSDDEIDILVTKSTK
ncbi:histamine N-methyltransferase-like [Glandiceps talaboti]